LQLACFKLFWINSCMILTIKFFTVEDNFRLGVLNTQVVWQIFNAFTLSHSVMISSLSSFISVLECVRLLESPRSSDKDSLMILLMAAMRSCICGYCLSKANWLAYFNSKSYSWRN